MDWIGPISTHGCMQLLRDGNYELVTKLCWHLVTNASHTFPACTAQQHSAVSTIPELLWRLL